MPTPQLSTGCAAIAGTGAGLPDQGQIISIRRKLEEIQRARLLARLKDLPAGRDMVRALGIDPDQYASQLAKLYTDLSLKLREPSPLRPNNMPSRLAATLNQLSDIFGLWQSALAPNATVALTQTPGNGDTGPFGISADIYPGQLALRGEILNGGAEEQWWVNIWQYIVPLPPSPATLAPGASMAYRFNVQASLAFSQLDVVSGSVHVYATLATTGDVHNRPLDFSRPDSSDFALIANLPTKTPSILSGTAKVTGTFPLSPGGTPTVGILIGLIISAASGDVQINPEFSNIELWPPVAASYTDIGKIQYRRDDSFWVEAVAAQLLAVSPSS